jgi:hypothetical protein
MEIMKRFAAVLALSCLHGYAIAQNEVQNLANARGFPEKLYAVSAYTSEAMAIDSLVGAEIELVVSRWLAQKLIASGGQAPAGAPLSWEDMANQLRKAITPIARQHLQQRPIELSSLGLNEKSLFLLEYERLLLEQKDRGDIRFSDGSNATSPGNQLQDVPDILAFHQTAAAVKWRRLWPELRAHAATLVALHYRVDADPGLGGAKRDWNARAESLMRPIGGRVLTVGDWRAMSEGRLGFTLSGLDRFLLPLGTEMSDRGMMRGGTTIRDNGREIVITQRDGRGLEFRLLDAKWERDISKRLSARELKQIDDALTAQYVEEKKRWFGALELEWDAYVNISRKIRSAESMQQLFQSFSARSRDAMAAVWVNWSRN